MHISRSRASMRAAYDSFRAQDLTAQCAALSRALLCIFFFGCACTGGGRYLCVGGVTPRMLIALLAALLALPALVRDRHTHLRSPALLLLLCFLIWLGVCAVRGYLAGNRTDVLLSDVKGFLWLFLMPVCAAVVRTEAQLRRLLSAVLAGAALQAAAALLCNAACALVPGLVVPLGDRTLALQLGTVSWISDYLRRIFSYSSPYLIIGCVIAVFRQARAARFRLSYAALTALYLSALLLTFTRSLYGAAGITAAVTLIAAALCSRGRLRRLLGHLLVSAALALTLVLAQEAVFQGPYLNFAVSRCVGQEVTISRASELRTALQRRFGLALTLPDDDAPPPDSDLEQALREEYLRATAASDLRRKTTERELLAMIRQNPLLGNGLGAAVPSRESGLDELFYLDTVCRMGVLGLLLYLAPLLALLWDTRKHLRHSSAASAQLTVFCGLAALLIATGFNPWMNAVLGIAWYSLAAALPGIGRDTSPAKNEKEFYT